MTKLKIDKLKLSLTWCPAKQKQVKNNLSLRFGSILRATQPQPKIASSYRKTVNVSWRVKEDLNMSNNECNNRYLNSNIIIIMLHLYTFTFIHTYIYIYIYIYISKMGAIYMQSRKQCALPVITSMALWQLMHLGIHLMMISRW